MEKYGIVDTGSNTIVLIVYEIKENMPHVLKYISTPAHLIDYVKDHMMSKQGIETARRTLAEYASILDEMEISVRYADITEPGRIQNRNELMDALASTGFHVIALTGEEEAACDYYGAMLTYREIKDGVAFDVGGGSTELIRFQNGECIDAMSFPYGCVRLSHLSLDTDICQIEIEKARKQYPSLDIHCSGLIGIGGTMRAAGLVVDALYGKHCPMQVKDLEDTFRRLRENETAAVQAMKQIVNAARIPVFLPGIHMILEICHAFHAKHIYVSETGIREGFLLKYVLKQEFL